MTISNGRFRCIHCGDRFDLDSEEHELHSNGYFLLEPDCCPDCNPNYVPDYPEFSDADPGL